MVDTTTLTIHIDQDLKAALEQAARAADQSIADYVIHAVKARMLPASATCARSSEAGVGAGLIPAWRAFVATWKKEKGPHTITVHNGNEWRAYTGHLAYNRDEGRDDIVVMTIEEAQGTVVVPIPLALITGWTLGTGAETYFRALGYVDGNVWAVRAAERARRKAQDAAMSENQTYRCGVCKEVRHGRPSGGVSTRAGVVVTCSSECHSKGLQSPDVCTLDEASAARASRSPGIA